MTRSTREEVPAQVERAPEEIHLQDEFEEPETDDEISALEEPETDDEVYVSENLDENNESVYVRPKLYQVDDREVDDFLSKLKEFFPESQARLSEIIQARLGTPYELGCLGEGSGRDPDPIFRLDVADCTVFMLTSVALLDSSTVEEARESMKQINYYPAGEVTYENRLHFTTYRNQVSSYFADITEEIGREKTKTKTVVLNKIKDDGQKLLDIDFEEEIEIAYIPAVSISEGLLSRMPLVAGVAFLKDGDEDIGLDVRHEGFLLNGSKLVHASSQKGGVVEEDFTDYLLGGNTPRFDGVIFFEIISLGR